MRVSGFIHPMDPSFDGSTSSLPLLLDSAIPPVVRVGGAGGAQLEPGILN